MQYRNSDEMPAISLRGLLAALRRQAVWILVTTLLGTGLTLYVVRRQRPVYEARATLRMPEQQYAPTTDILSALNGPSTIETEMEIVRSRSVAEKVVQALGLQLTIIEPRGVPQQSLFGVLRFASDARPGTYVVRRDTTAFSVTAPSGETVGSPYGVPLEVGGVTLEPLPLADSSAGPAQITLSVAGLSDAAEGLRGGLRVTRPQDYAGIVAVAWQSTDPVLAMQVVNGVAEAYIQKRGESQRETYHAAAEFLRTQVDTIHAQLAQAEQALQQFQRATGLVDPATQATDQVRRAADLRVRSEELTQQSSILWNLIARTKQPAESAADWTVFAGSSALAQNQTISDIVGKLTTLEIERSRMLAGRTAAEAQVANLTGIIAGLRSQLRTLAGSMLQGLDDEKRSVQTTLDRSDARLAVV
ncbi:MAG TPA: Wzz/FepE/Etk N-terminal domain-containing protein, partial [Gemmatimonadales bacterium]